MEKSDYPEHDKLLAIQKESQAIGEFIDWLHNENLSICELEEDHPGYGRFYRTQRTTNDLLSKFFGIDQKKIEQEKLAMLDSIRNKQTT